MMDDYISKTEAFDIVRFECGEWSGLAKTIGKRFDDLPHADVQPVRHGHWINHPDDLFPEDSMIECSVCHEYEYATVNDNFCGNCGAKMDEVK